jgi:hypothetical protein
MVMAVVMGGGIAAVAVIITDGVEVGDIITVGDTIATDFKLQGAAPVWRPNHLFATRSPAVCGLHIMPMLRAVADVSTRRRLFAALQLANLRDVATGFRLTAAVVVAISVIEGGGRTYPTPIGSGLGSNSGA